MKEVVQQPVYTHDHHHFLYKRLSWTAVFVGAFIGMGLGFLLNLFGIAIGLSAFTLTADGAYALTIGGLIGMLIGVIVSMMTAGYAAGYLGRLWCPQRNLGLLYGFVTWSLALFLSAVLATHVNNYIMAYTDNVTRSTAVVTSTGDTVAKPAVGVNPTPTKNNNDNEAAAVNLTPESMAWAAFAVFIMFFVGAASCCIGAAWGMMCRRED